MSIVKKIFGDPNEKFLRQLSPIVKQINQLEASITALSDQQLKEKTEEFKKQLQAGKSLDDILPEAFACVREASRRTLSQRHYDVQLVAGMALHRGQIAEMRTGEGKTLAATLPLYLNALEGKGAHLVTVNDYLSSRDCGWMGPIYHLLGLSSGVIVHDQAFIFDPSYVNESHQDERLSHLKLVSRKVAYNADITYGTNNEFGFDYLRDNMVQTVEQMVQRDLHYSIVDEVDSILIDEARTPLIISAPDMESTEKYHQFAKLVTKLQEGEDYNVDEKMRAATLTEEGINKMEKLLGVENIYTDRGISEVHHIEQALRAHALFKIDRDYVVKDGEVIIVDEFTGRLMYGRRYSEGLHQAIEAKEDVEVQRESRTLATITFQNYFRLYKKLAGMTGTAATEAEEFFKIYNLEVTVIPTNKPMVRTDLADRIYKNEEGKFQAVAQEIRERHQTGQPILIGTISIEKNERLAALLEREGIQAQTLNAKQHEKEAQIIAQAGKLGAVTVATNMAGRGVDIKLGGDPSDPAEEQKIKDLGGLHIIGTERHESRRIDNQLRGRSGRQGDPGSTQFYVSMDDDLMRIFGSDRMKGLMERLKVPDDMPIENRLISRSLEAAQKKVESHHFDIRKHLVEYDDVINKHRETIYKKRKEILTLSDLKDKVLTLVMSEIKAVVNFHTASDDENTWNIEEIYEVVNTIFPIPTAVRLKLSDIAQEAGTSIEDKTSRGKLIGYLYKLAVDYYSQTEDRINQSAGSPEAMRQVEKGIMLRSIDTLWIEHLEAIDHLRTGIGLRAYGQHDPLVEYKREAYGLFKELLALVQKQVVYSIFKVGVATQMAPSVMQQAASHATFQAPAKTMAEGQSAIAAISQNQATPQQKEVAKRQSQLPTDDTTHYQGQKVGRNDPCPCGSGKKFKKCHGA
ncbi:MAG: preprotein translocase subunit SecA [Candidatus Buchananbacteria bacterium RIFCSPHIGHO2_01_FULL_44_11]|uniref:Protein translocase subunit SecA n=1 Tax=Candidatus Buchananbacteria bacterium RIFCSPHIGHO2_01_FULL_44_11 TaxID=1797535 RepID=A0A1G1XZ70_9BACT|nr:MAG: preprotein translocase subunit SecA [Candidatus Buchananbacteria bacterium RIFCSPHIGHO2_01_FULL_44_11]